MWHRSQGLAPQFATAGHPVRRSWLPHLPMLNHAPGTRGYYARRWAWAPGKQGRLGCPDTRAWAQCVQERDQEGSAPADRTNMHEHSIGDSIVLSIDFAVNGFVGGLLGLIVELLNTIFGALAQFFGSIIL